MQNEAASGGGQALWSLRGRQLTEAAASSILPPHSKQALVPGFKREKISNIKYKKKGHKPD